MGVFLNSLILPGRGREQVRQMLATLDPELVKKCQLEPNAYRWGNYDHGTSVILNDHAVPFDTLPLAASKALDGTALLAYIYDDDFWGYELYHKGDCLDMFWTLPNYFGDPDPRLTRHTPEQHAGLLAQYFSIETERLLPYLNVWTEESDGQIACPGDEFTQGDCWQLADFLRCLGYWGREEVPETAPEEEDSGPKSSGTEVVNPTAPFRPREPVLFHSTDLPRCLPLLKTVRLLPAPQRRLLGLLPPKPVEVETLLPVDLNGEKLERLLENFFSGKTRRLELDMELPGKGIFVKRLKKMVSQPIRFTVELFQEEGRFLCLCLDDEDQYLYWLIADRDVYFNEESDEHNMTTLLGQSVEAYLVHSGPALMREEVYLMLSNLDRRDEVFNCLGRMGVWSNEWHYRNKKKHQEARERWCFPASDKA